MGFRSLQHTRVRRSTCREPCLSPLRSVLRVWLPSRRLTPSEPLPAFFRAGGAHGIRPSELSPLGRYPPRFRSRWTHMPFLPSVFPAAEADGPAQRAAAPGLSPCRESLATAAGLVQRPLDAPLGFAPSRVYQHRPCTSSRPHSSHALRGVHRSERPLRHGVSLSRSLGLTRLSRQGGAGWDEATLVGFWHQ